MSGCNNAKPSPGFDCTMQHPSDLVVTANDIEYKNKEKLSSEFSEFDYEQNTTEIRQNYQTGSTVIKVTLNNDVFNTYYNEVPRDTQNRTRPSSDRDFDTAHNVSSSASINSNMNQENSDADINATVSQLTVDVTGTRDDRPIGSASSVGQKRRYGKYRTAVHALNAAEFLGKGRKKNTRFKNGEEVRLVIKCVYHL